MFYTYAEKQGNVFFDGWQMRQVAFDTMRRYLYYSAATLTETQIASPMDNDNILSGRDSLGGSSSTSPTSRTSPGMPPTPTRYQEFSSTPPQPNLPSDVQWRKKIKVDYIQMIAKDHEFLLEDSHLRENDLFQVEIHGETRVLQQGEYPAPGPMLVHAAGWAGLPDRFTVDNEEYIADPYFLRELYEALRDQFANLRLERERLERTTGNTRDPRLAKIQTLLSPRAKGEGLAKGSRVKIVMRLRSEYEFRRFWFVVQSVLGYDKLGVRPYRGLPPYDPRNGLIFAQIPMCVYHTFKALDKAVIYSFLRGDLVGRTTKGELTIFLRGAYLCITHDMVMVLRDTGNIPRWVRLQEVRTFEYNRRCHKPYFAFLTDPGAPDIVFIPQPPIYGPEAIRKFSPQVETMRVRHVIHESCLASVVARRVIAIKEAPESAVRSFVERVERENGRSLSFDPVVGYNGALSCPLPKEQLAAVWREVQSIYAARDPVAISQAAIPLYSNNTNDTELTADQLRVLERRLDRERETRYDIVGIPIDEARQVDPSQVPERHGRHRRTNSQDGGGAGTHAHEPEHRTSSSSQGLGGLHRANTVNNGEISHMRNRQTSPQPAASSTSDGTRGAATPQHVVLPEDRLQTPQLETAPYGSNPLQGLDVLGEVSQGSGPSGPRMGVSVASDYVSNASFTNNSFVYGVPGARYLTAEEVEAGVGGVTPSALVPESHVLVFGQTPMAGGATAPYQQASSFLGGPQEVNVDELMSRSFAFMRTTVPAPRDPPPPAGVHDSSRSQSTERSTSTHATNVPSGPHGATATTRAAPPVATKSPKHRSSTSRGSTRSTSGHGKQSSLASSGGSTGRGNGSQRGSHLRSNHSATEVPSTAHLPRQGSTSNTTVET